MPEAPEIRISSDFVNSKCKDIIFTSMYDVGKGNNAVKSNIISNFNISADFNGKELNLFLNDGIKQINISVFMGMSGNWKYVNTNEWNDIKYTRLRFDNSQNKSLLLYGGYMGPKYKIGGFNGTKRGPDPIKEFNLFKKNILDNIEKKEFNKPIYEVLLNQEYFNGVGNYIRSTILFYLNHNPFLPANIVIKQRPEIIDLCKNVIEKSYQLNGGQLKDWKNPFDSDSSEFNDWVFYKKGSSIKDSNKRTFWYDSKWDK